MVNYPDFHLAHSKNSSMTMVHHYLHKFLFNTRPKDHCIVKVLRGSVLQKDEGGDGELVSMENHKDYARKWKSSDALLYVGNRIINVPGQ